jgi:hypothetical protein
VTLVKSPRRQCEFFDKSRYLPEIIARLEDGAPSGPVFNAEFIARRMNAHKEWQEREQLNIGRDRGTYRGRKAARNGRADKEI